MTERSTYPIEGVLRLSFLNTEETEKTKHRGQGNSVDGDTALCTSAENGGSFTLQSQGVDHTRGRVLILGADQITGNTGGICLSSQDQSFRQTMRQQATRH